MTIISKLKSLWLAYLRLLREPKTEEQIIEDRNAP